MRAVTKVLSSTESDEICEPKCREQVVSLRQETMETCTSSDSAIRDHGATGRFCDDVYWDWCFGNKDFDQCHDCCLGSLAVQISSPIGVANHTVSRFEQVKAACPNAEYNVEVPTSWESATPVTPKEGTENCARHYTVKKGVTCRSISLAQISSTIDLINNNAIDADCKSMPDEGTKLCLAETFN